MAGMNLHRIASALVRFIRREIRRSARSQGLGVHRHWGSGNGRRGRRGRHGHHDHHGSAAAGPSHPPTAVHHAYQAPPMPDFVAPPAFVAPHMDWQLEYTGGIFCPVHRYGPCPSNPANPPLESEIDGGDTYLDFPTPTPADEEPLAPPGYGPVPAIAEWEVILTEMAGASAPSEAADACAPTEAAEASAPTEATGSGATIPASPPPSPQARPWTPPAAARRILRRFAAALERHHPGLRSGSWAHSGLNLPGYDAAASAPSSP
ncbi:hypothetical protein ZWY2020_009232 [Hordeum vulgare]|nr:hypothetical protein ZWY2020_009232 [Hordeum vulgare]